MSLQPRDVVEEQISYYRARASEYDEWFLRQGRYDRGEAHRQAWFGEVAALKQALLEARPRGHCLELACGTGIWTEVLAQHCDAVTAVDASPEVLSINREKLSSSSVRYVEADLFTWRPEETYDFVFFSFWLSHVPQERFAGFWDMVRGALRPGGRAFFVDSLLENDSTARDHGPLDTSGVVERKLNDGRRFQIVKIFYDPADLEARLVSEGWTAKLRPTGRFFFCGEVVPNPAQGSFS